MEHDRTPAPEPIWTVREEENTVIVEITVRDNYEAIHLCEVIASGIRAGGLTLVMGSGANVE